jgi:uncharacterized membrane protein
MVLTAPIMLVGTRILADAIFKKTLQPAATHLLILLGLAYGLGFLLAAPYYLLVADLSNAVALAAIVNYLLVGGIWVVSVFLTALMDYKTITLSFVAGLLVSFLASLGLATRFGTAGMLWGFSAGLGLLQSSLVSKVLVTFPFQLQDPRRTWFDYASYWMIGLAGLVYSLGIWADKWVMWFAPERHRLAGTLIFYPDYDGAMFLAFLTTIPAFAVFTMMAETDFFERHRSYQRSIRDHGSLQTIQENQQAIATSLFEGFRNISVLQATVTALFIFLAPKIVAVFGITMLQISMFRIGVLGAFFHVMFLFSTIVLSYFDLRKSILFLNLLFLLANGVFTVVGMKMGFRFYGYGYFLASMCAFVAGCTIVASAVRRLPYLTFVRRGSLLR